MGMAVNLGGSMSHQLDSYQEFEQRTVEVAQSTKQILVAAERILHIYPQVQVWMNPLADLIKVLGRYPREDRLTDQFPQYAEQLRWSLLRVAIVGEAVADTLPAQPRVAMGDFVSTCRDLLNVLPQAQV
jgi:hypothetical protein